MKRFLSAVVFCGFLLVLCLFFFSPGESQADNNLLPSLLNLPAPPPPNPLMPNAPRVRQPDFFDKKNPPPDDAPLDDLLDYWQSQSSNYRELGYNIKPSEKALRRILKACEEDPEKLADYLNILPADDKIADQVKYYYDQELSDDKLGEDWQRRVKNWLTFNSKFYVDKLLKKARAVRDENEYVTNQEELLALTKVDWDSARPLLDTLLANSNQPVSNTLAKWAYYQHALDVGDNGDIERYRDLLKEVVENKEASPGMRDLAMDALVKQGDWEGRDEWYLKLLEDETLLELNVNGQTYTGLTTIISSSPPEKYIDRMIEMLKSDNQTVRSAVVRNLSTLLGEGNPEVVRALLPWLLDPKWAREVQFERRNLISALINLKMPESVPGLISVLNEKSPRAGSRYAGNMAANANAKPALANAIRTAERAVKEIEAATRSANSATNAVVVRDYGSEEVYPYRDGAVSALAEQGDPRAVPALRGVLPEVDGYQRGQVVRAVLKCKGFSVPEQLNAIETLIRTLAKMQDEFRRYGANATGEMANMSPVMGSVTELPPSIAYGTGRFDASQVPLLLGSQLTNETEVSDELVVAVANRIEYLERSDPKMASSLKQVMERWRGPAIDLLRLKDLKKGTIKLDFLVALLARRKELREARPNEIFDVRNGTPLARGIAACLLEDDNEYEGILSGENAESKAAMLGCARLVRANLPLEKVAANLKSPNKQLALAAERYLESEDSPQARQIIFAHYPETARILGAWSAFEPQDSQSSSADLSGLFCSVNPFFCQSPALVTGGTDGVIANEKKLKKEIDENKQLSGVYSYDNNFIRIYPDRVAFSWEEDVSRYRERDLTKEEFEGFRDYLIRQNMDELPPFLSDCEYCDGSEFLMLGRGGGRRIFFRGNETPKIQEDLKNFFAEMRRKPAKLHYWLEKAVPGLEILFEDETLQARTLWKNGDEMRLLIEDAPRRKQVEKAIRAADQDYEEDLTGENPNNGEDYETNWLKRRREHESDGLAWYKFSGGKLSEPAAQPPGVEYFSIKDALSVLPDEQQWKARAAGFEIRADASGLYKVAGGRAVKIKEGIYAKPVVTQNGRWVIATKTVDYEMQMVRINLLTLKEFRITVPEDSFRSEAVAFIPSINKVLIFCATYTPGDDYEGEGEGDYVGPREETPIAEMNGTHFLFDADTGNMAQIRNDVRPLKQQTYRPLQQATTPDTFWAAIPDPESARTQFGIYSTRTLSFKVLLTLPQIQFGSLNLWVDDKEGKAYFVYEGHLLRFPLPKPPS